MTSTGVIKAQQHENPNFLSRLLYTPCDRLTLRRAELDEVKPTKYLSEIMGRMALLEYSSLRNLILYFATGVSLCHWCVPHSSLPTRVIQQLGYVCPGHQSCCLGTDLHPHPQPMCQDDAQNSGVTVSDTNQSDSAFSPHNTHCDMSATSGSLWIPAIWNLHLHKVKCPTGSQHSWAQAMHSPRGNAWLSTLLQVAAGPATYRGSSQANSWHSSVSWLSREARSSPLTL